MIRELNFPRVFHNGSLIGYGGNQEWFADYWKRSAGCACTSGVNIAAYYASAYPEMRGLYNGDVTRFDREEFVAAMEEMYSYMRPGFMGYPHVSKFAEQFVKFCKDRGVMVTANILEAFNTAADAFAFVKAGIDSGHPVALLILLHRARQLKDDNWHWVTISGYTDEEDGKSSPQIIVSNCGERELINTDILFEVHHRNRIRVASFQNA